MMTQSPKADQALATPLLQVRDSFHDAEQIAGRAQNAATLIAISKTQAADAIVPLLEQGQRHFGENRVQEAQDKWPALLKRYPDVTLHLVGQLQSNKAAEAVALFDVIHSLDRPSLLVALAKAMAAADKRVPCFLQVNIGAEEQKGGCPIADVPALLEQARAANVPVIGLMCVPPVDVEAAPYFALLAKLAKDNGMDQLSMGMSGDYETAIMLGATHVRVGTALFGARTG
jgi:PLP dependent protein